MRPILVEFFSLAINMIPPPLIGSLSTNNLLSTRPKKRCVHSSFPYVAKCVHIYTKAVTFILVIFLTKA